MQLVCLRPTGEKLEETWNDAKKMLSNSQLLQNLKNYPKVRPCLGPVYLVPI